MFKQISTSRPIEVQINMTSGCYLQVTDITGTSNSEDSYEKWQEENSDWKQHVFIDFLESDSYNTDISNTLEDSIRCLDLETTDIRTPYTYKLPKDGLYIYNKYCIEKLIHLKIPNTNTYNANEKLFYYSNGDTWGIYIGTTNGQDEASTLNSAKKIEDYSELSNLITNEVEYWTIKEIVSICYLNKCLISLQKKMIYDNLGNKCTYDSCSSDESVRNMRNFLFDSVYILSYLIKQGSYLEAQRIIEDLTSCNYICKDILGETNYNKCDCGATI